MSQADALDTWLADDTVVAVRDDEASQHDAEATDEASADAGHSVDLASAWTGLDPVSAWLLRVALALIIVVLVTSGAMVIFFMSAGGAPRTVVERNTAAAEIAVRERPSDSAAWEDLAYAQAAAGRHDEALETIRTGRTATDEQTLLLPEADILRAAGRHTESLSVYDDAIGVLSRDESATAAALAGEGVTMSTPSNSLIRAYYGRGLSYGALGDNARAIRDVLKASQLAPTQTTISVSLGDLYAASGQDELAKAAYTQALRYVPDNAEALAGLAKLKKGE